VLGGDKVDGDQAVLDELADELDSHIDMLHLMVGRSRSWWGALVHRKRVTSRIWIISSMRKSKALISDSVDECASELIRTRTSWWPCKRGNLWVGFFAQLFL
jgi:phage gp46-like protein